MLTLRHWCALGLVLLFGAQAVPGADPADVRDFKAAALSFKAGVWERAERELEQFNQRHPASELRTEARLLQAQARLELGNFEGAAQLLEAGRTNAGGLAGEYGFWRAETEFRRGNYRAAQDGFAAFSLQFTNSPRLLEAVIGEAAAAARREDWPRVRRVLDAPDGAFQRLASGGGERVLVARGWLLLAEAWLAEENLAAAETVLQRVTPGAAETALAWQRDYLRARLLFAQGRREDALPLTKTLAGQVTNQPALLAGALALQARMEEALERPGDAEATWRRNLAASAPAERQREALMQLGELLLRQGRIEETAAAVEQFLASPGSAPVQEAAWLTLAEVRLRQFGAGGTNALAAARLACEEFLQRFPHSPLAGRAHLNLGWCRWLAGDQAGSAEAFAAARERLAPGFHRAVAEFKLADALAAQARPADALPHYQSVAANAAGLPEVQTNLVERALYQMVRVAGDAGDAGAANAAMARLLEEFPNGALAERTLLTFGSATEAQPDPAAKRRVFADFVARQPDSPLAPMARLAIARTHELEADWTAAAAAYQDWLAAHPRHPARPRAAFFAALATARAGDETNAFQQFTAWLAQYPTNEQAALAQWWVADHFWRAGDFVNAERNYQLVFQNHPGSPLVWEAQLMAGRAAVAREQPEQAISYFTNLTSDLRNCPTNVYVRALFAYGDTLVLLGAGDAAAAAANHREAIKVFSKLHSTFPDQPAAIAALGRIGDCYFQLGALDTNAAAASYGFATNAYQQVVNAPAADAAARAQAEIGLGLVSERQAALPGVTNAAALQRRALDHYLNVVFAATERTDAPWVKKAGLEALRLTEQMGWWAQTARLCDLLAEALPAEQPWLARKKSRAEEQLRANGN